MNVLVIGGGGREHALVWKLSQSQHVDKLYCVPGNPGIAQLAECATVDIEDNSALRAFAQAHDIGYTVVGPEVPLTNGIVDEFTAHGLKIFGPDRLAARIEGSKAFAKALMKKYRIPTADYGVFSLAEDALAFIKKHGAPIVVKADGLAAGKGVIVAMTEQEAVAAVEEIMCDKKFGSAGNTVLLEEFLEGEEASLLAFTDGTTVIPMIAAQDHKRVNDGDEGPNTGGMGAYAPAPVITPELRCQITAEIIEPTIAAMRAEGCPYKGCLYTGLMITSDGPKVIEYNARFGDPETQAVLPLLDSDLLTIMEACSDGRLADASIAWQDAAAVCVVLSAAGYPGSYHKGDTITGLAEAAEDAVVFHAGTARQADSFVTNGGRVLGVTAVAPTIRAAVDKTYAAVQSISFAGAHFRNDIAYRALKRS